MKSYTLAFVHGISRVNAFPKFHDWEYSVQEVKISSGFLGLGKSEKKLCVGSWGDWTPVDEWKSSNRYVEEGKVYMNPHADIHYVDGKRTTKYFDTVDELTEFIDQIKALAPSLIIE